MSTILIFADSPVKSSVESLGRLFTIVMALAIGEAFKQFVSDKAEKPEDRHIHWGRIWALIAFMLLVVPFSHGMARYVYETYQHQKLPEPYWIFLSIDSLVFMTESVLFFILSRSLPIVQWRRFYIAVFCLLALDAVWGLFTFYLHKPEMGSWAYVNLVTCLLLAIILLYKTKGGKPVEPAPSPSPAPEVKPGEKPKSDAEKVWPTLGAGIALVVVLARTIADYYVCFDFYFPAAKP